MWMIVASLNSVIFTYSKHKASSMMVGNGFGPFSSDIHNKSDSVVIRCYKEVYFYGTFDINALNAYF